MLHDNLHMHECLRPPIGSIFGSGTHERRERLLRNHRDDGLEPSRAVPVDDGAVGWANGDAHLIEEIRRRAGTRWVVGRSADLRNAGVWVRPRHRNDDQRRIVDLQLRRPLRPTREIPREPARMFHLEHVIDIGEHITAGRQPWVIGKSGGVRPRTEEAGDSGPEDQSRNETSDDEARNDRRSRRFPARSGRSHDGRPRTRRTNSRTQLIEPAIDVLAPEVINLPPACFDPRSPKRGPGRARRSGGRRSGRSSDDRRLAFRLMVREERPGSHPEAR